MNHESELKLQAWLDGELSQAEAKGFPTLADQDEETRLLLAELRVMKTSLSTNEPQYSVPATREFYWSQIERRIRSESHNARADKLSQPIWMRRWFRLLAPACAGLTLAVVYFLPMFHRAPDRWITHAEIENPRDDVTSVTFRSESDHMTVYWVSTQ